MEREIDIRNRTLRKKAGNSMLGERVWVRVFLGKFLFEIHRRGWGLLVSGWR